MEQLEQNGGEQSGMGETPNSRVEVRMRFRGVGEGHMGVNKGNETQEEEEWEIGDETGQEQNNFDN